MKVFIKRTFSSVILVLLVLACIYVDWLAGLVVVVFSVMGLYEFFEMLSKKGIYIYKLFGLGIGAIIPLSIVLRFELTKPWELLFIVLAMLMLIVMQFTRRQNHGTVVGISTTIFGIMYVSWFLSFMIKIRYMPDGALLAGMLLAVTKLGDMGAYVVGSKFGRRLLMPRVSPKKSVEGAIGGLAASCLAAVCFKPFLPFSLVQLALLGCSLGLIGQLGDLCESLMKRDCQVKDSAQTIPGIGGVLDLIDSLLFTSPVFYFYLSIIK